FINSIPGMGPLAAQILAGGGSPGGPVGMGDVRLSERHDAFNRLSVTPKLPKVLDPDTFSSDEDKLSAQLDDLIRNIELAAKNFGNLDDAVEAYQDKIIKGGEAADKLNVDFVNFDKYLAIALAQTGGRPMTPDELAAAKYDIGMGIVGRAGTAMKVL